MPRLTTKKLIKRTTVFDCSACGKKHPRLTTWLTTKWNGKIRIAIEKYCFCPVTREPIYIDDL